MQANPLTRLPPHTPHCTRTIAHTPLYAHPTVRAPNCTRTQLHAHHCSSGSRCTDCSTIRQVCAVCALRPSTPSPHLRDSSRPAVGSASTPYRRPTDIPRRLGCRCRSCSTRRPARSLGPSSPGDSAPHRHPLAADVIRSSLRRPRSDGVSCGGSIFWRFHSALSSSTPLPTLQTSPPIPRPFHTPSFSGHPTVERAAAVAPPRASTPRPLRPRRRLPRHRRAESGAHGEIKLYPAPSHQPSL